MRSRVPRRRAGLNPERIEDLLRGLVGPWRCQAPVLPMLAPCIIRPSIIRPNRPPRPGHALRKPGLRVGPGECLTPPRPSEGQVRRYQGWPCGCPKAGPGFPFPLGRTVAGSKAAQRGPEPRAAQRASMARTHPLTLRRSGPPSQRVWGGPERRRSRAPDHPQTLPGGEPERSARRGTPPRFGLSSRSGAAEPAGRLSGRAAPANRPRTRSSSASRRAGRGPRRRASPAARRSPRGTRS